MGQLTTGTFFLQVSSCTMHGRVVTFVSNHSEADSMPGVRTGRLSRPLGVFGAPAEDARVEAPEMADVSAAVSEPDSEGLVSRLLLTSWYSALDSSPSCCALGD